SLKVSAFYKHLWRSAESEHLVCELAGGGQGGSSLSDLISFGLMNSSLGLRDGKDVIRGPISFGFAQLRLHLLSSSYDLLVLLSHFGLALAKRRVNILQAHQQHPDAELQFVGTILNALA